MYTVTYTNSDGNLMRLLLTDEEFERGLHRAQENAGDVEQPRKPIREVIGDPMHPDVITGRTHRDGASAPDPLDNLRG